MRKIPPPVTQIVVAIDGEWCVIKTTYQTGVTKLTRFPSVVMALLNSKEDFNNMIYYNDTVKGKGI